MTRQSNFRVLNIAGLKQAWQVSWAGESWNALAMFVGWDVPNFHSGVPVPRIHQWPTNPGKTDVALERGVQGHHNAAADRPWDWSTSGLATLRTAAHTAAALKGENLRSKVWGLQGERECEIAPGFEKSPFGVDDGDRENKLYFSALHMRY